MAGNAVTIDFAGDASKLQAAAKRATAATDAVAKSAKEAGADYDKAGAASDKYGEKMGALGSATTGAIDAVDTLGGGVQALADIQDHGRAKAAALARANVDVMQATEDMAQATRDAAQAGIDSEQAAIDLTQARLDEKTALQEYNEAVKEHGRGSDEARQAQIDLKQAGLDVKQATEDSAQAVRDASQANIDAKTAQVDLNDAMHEANPPELQGWADKIGLITPLLGALVGVTSLVTAAQWLFNASLWANPITWVVIGIVALIAIIVLLVKNWDTVKAAGTKAGTWIKDKWLDLWGWMKKLPGRIGDAFGSIGNKISAPFRAAFNYIADAWNNTVGRLSWSVPGWVPGIGGNSISVPHLPKFHTGGVVPGPPGTEVPILAMAGEEVGWPGQRGGGETMQVIVKLDSEVLLEGLAKVVKRRGGGTQLVIGVGHG